MKKQRKGHDYRLTYSAVKVGKEKIFVELDFQCSVCKNTSEIIEFQAPNNKKNYEKALSFVHDDDIGEPYSEVVRAMFARAYCTSFPLNWPATADIPHSDSHEDYSNEPRENIVEIEQMNEIHKEEGTCTIE